MSRRKALMLIAGCAGILLALVAPLWLIPDLNNPGPAAARIRTQHVLDGGQDEAVHISANRTEARVDVNGTCYLVLINSTGPGAAAEVEAAECVPTLPVGR